MGVRGVVVEEWDDLEGLALCLSQIEDNGFSVEAYQEWREVRGRDAADESSVDRYIELATERDADRWW